MTSLLHTSVRGRGAVGWLTAYLVLLLFVPSRLVVGPLGSAGAPSMLFGLGSLLLWLLLFLAANRRYSPGSQPVRVALGVFLFCVGITYVLAMSRPQSSDETSPATVALLALASWSGTLLLTHDAIYTRNRFDTLMWRLVVCGGIEGKGLFYTYNGSTYYPGYLREISSQEIFYRISRSVHSLDTLVYLILLLFDSTALGYQARIIRLNMQVPTESTFGISS